MSEPEVPHFYPDRRAATPDGREAGPVVVLTGADLTIAEVEAVARSGARVALDVHARERMQEARDVIESLVADGAVVYGVTTGFGALASTRIDPADASRLQENLLMSHAAGVGSGVPARDRPGDAAAPREHARPRPQRLPAASWSTAFSTSSRRASIPVVPEQGSVGASGDLAPLAHLALPLIGRGRVEFQGVVTPALVALRETGLEPLTLEAKEGLALLNGTQMMGAIGALLLADADRLGRTASVVAAMSVEALLGTDVAFAAAYQLARPHPGQIAVAAELRHLLRDSALQTGHHGHAHKVQDPYSLRCIPQVHGAVRDTLDHLRRVLDIELNSATDNPLVFPGGGVADEGTLATGGGRVISGGNFHGEPIALALDFAKIALAELGSISERRTALLVDPRLNGGLPPFLAAESGIDSGMMIYQYTAAALVSENKVLAHPASVDSIPTSANQEDHVSMGSISARHARSVLGHVETILAIELLVAAQALDLRIAGPDGAAPGVGRGRGARSRARAGPPSRRRPRARAGPRGRDRDGPRRSARGPRRQRMTTTSDVTADVIVVGAGVQGASLAFHLARRGAQVLVVERETTAAGATGRSSGFVRMHYDLESDARLAWLSFPYFLDWAGRVGAGDCAYVRTGFLQVFPPALADAVRANVAAHQAIGIDTRTVTPQEIAELVPGVVLDGIEIGAFEPQSGYADPSGTAAGFLEAARRLGARYRPRLPGDGVAVDGDRVVGVDIGSWPALGAGRRRRRGRLGRGLARTAGVEVPVQAWRHDDRVLRAADRPWFGLPDRHRRDQRDVLPAGGHTT